jgi:hypothetical protein
MAARSVLLNPSSTIATAGLPCLKPSRCGFWATRLPAAARSISGRCPTRDSAMDLLAFVIATAAFLLSIAAIAIAWDAGITARRSNRR